MAQIAAMPRATCRPVSSIADAAALSPAAARSKMAGTSIVSPVEAA